MVRNFEISGLDCLCCAPAADNGKIAYILYPMDMLSDWIETATKKYGTAIAVITGMDWQNVMSPWPAKGVPKGSPDFKGEATDFQHKTADFSRNFCHFARIIKLCRMKEIVKVNSIDEYNRLYFPVNSIYGKDWQCI